MFALFSPLVAASSLAAATSTPEPDSMPSSSNAIEVFPEDSKRCDGSTKFGYRDIDSLHQQETVDPVFALPNTTIPSWLRGSFYKHSGGAFSPGDESLLDGLAHVCAWHFFEDKITFSNNFPRTDLYEEYVKSGGERRGWVGTGATNADSTGGFNPNVNFQRVFGNIVAALLEAPEPQRVAKIFPREGGVDPEKQDFNELLKSCPEDDAMVFLASHHLEGEGQNNLYGATYLKPGPDMEVGYRIYRMCHKSEEETKATLLWEGLFPEQEEPLSKPGIQSVLCQNDPTRAPCYIHSVFETEHYFVIPHGSARLDLRALLQPRMLAKVPLLGKFFPQKPFFDCWPFDEGSNLEFLVWKKTAGTGASGSGEHSAGARSLSDRSGPGGLTWVGRVKADAPGFSFHGLNAFDIEGEKIVLDMDWKNRGPSSAGKGQEGGQSGGLADWGLGGDLCCCRNKGEKKPFLSNTNNPKTSPAESDQHGPASGSGVVRFELDLATSKAQQSTLFDESPGFGCVNPFFVKQDYQYGYVVSPGFRSVTKLDVTTNRRTEWQLASGSGQETEEWLVGEPQFVPNPSPGGKEDDGVILVPAAGKKNGKSFLVLLDASTMQEIARVPALVDVNYGLHSIFIPAEDGGGASHDENYVIKF